MAKSRSRADIERRDEASHTSSDLAADRHAFLLLTEEERLVLIWKKAGFSDLEIANHLSQPTSAVRETYRRGAATIRRSLETRRGVDTPDDDLPLNCPLCGVRLAFRGRANDCRVFTCAVHGGYCMDRSGRFRPTANCFNH